MDEQEARSKGWKKRGVYDDPRLTEISDLYKELGFMVKLEPFRPKKETGCRKCIMENPDNYRVLYTKKK